MKLSCRFRYPLQSLMISVLLSSVLSLVFTLVNRDPEALFLLAWLESFAVGVGVGFPVSRLAVPRIIRFCDRLCQGED